MNDIKDYEEKKALYDHIAREAVRSVLLNIEAAYAYQEMDPQLEAVLNEAAGNYQLLLYEKQSYPTILLPLHWKYCEAILDRKKDLEIRLSFPVLLAPFRVLIYATKGTHQIYRNGKLASGKIIGEFVCRECNPISPRAIPTVDSRYWVGTDVLNRSCLSLQEFNDYGKGRALYAWNVEDPREFETYHELSELRYYSTNSVITSAPQGYCRVHSPEF